MMSDMGFKGTLQLPAIVQQIHPSGVKVSEPIVPKDSKLDVLIHMFLAFQMGFASGRN